MLSSARADAPGNFRIDLPRSAPERSFFRLVVGGTGWALGGKDFDSGLPSEDQTINLQPERILRGRFIDLQGQPIAGVAVRVYRYYRYNTLPYEAAGEAPAWPGPVTTDDLGRFTLRGLGPNGTITLEAASDSYAHQFFRIDPGDEAWGHEQTFALSPAQVIEAHVTHADDKPVVGAWINVLSSFRNTRSRLPLPRETSARTGEQGVARVIPTVGDSFSITAGPPVGEPYLNQRVDINWPKGAIRQPVEFKLKHGVPVRGTITEEGSGKPVASALVSYAMTRRIDRLYRDFQSWLCEAVTGHEGHFELVVPAGPGRLLVRAAAPDYLHVTTNELELGTGLLPSRLMYPDALAHIDPKPDETSHEVTMRLRRGVTAVGRVVGPDGQPVAKAIAFGRTYVPYRTGAPFVSFNGSAPEIKVRDGQFEIPGCDPQKPYTFHFFDREHQLGATMELTGKSNQNGPVVVQLQKCGAARVRYKDSQGKPVAGYQPAASRQLQDQLALIITPGTDTFVRDKTMADIEYQVNLDTQRMRGLRTGADGRVIMESLIPGATYRFHGRDFTAEAGKTVDLPDVIVSRQ